MGSIVEKTVMKVEIAQEIQSLGEDFWNWRRDQQPRSHDDIPRIERSLGWAPKWSGQDVERYKKEAAIFADRHVRINAGSADKPNCSIESYVDYRLIGSAIARITWEIDYLKIWQEQPRFYIDQSIGVIFDHLLPPTITEEIIKEVIFVFTQCGRILGEGLQNLAGDAVKEYAEVAIELLHNIEPQIKDAVAALKPLTSDDLFQELKVASDDAISHFLNFRKWLVENKDSMGAIEPVGVVKYQWFFDNVALVPYTPEYMREVGLLEWERAVTLQSLAKNKHRNQTLPEIPATAAIQVENERAAEESIRNYYESEGILSQPKSLGHYLNAAIPAYLIPLRWLGVTDDLTGPSRVDEDGYSYVPTPDKDLPYFYAANARDTRAGIVHEGAHYQQLALSWRHPRTLRRHYYDSGSNEGVAFYNEELMLAAGLFDDAPHSQILMYNFMKLRAMRVIVDVNLATGEIDIPTATSYLEKKVPMDHATAYDEAVFFASCPGQALTYQIGKTQIIKFYSDSIEKFRGDFSIRNFHDYLWLNGNIPISLARLEFLSDPQDILTIDARKGKK
ncbi:MAG: DUF885 family protein [Actinomycetota bacterium]|nr:DUF885 family protein [Actinomycetota bacterium]